MVKNPPANVGDMRDMGSIPGWGRSLEEEMATDSSILAWEIPRTEEPDGLQSMESQSAGLKHLNTQHEKVHHMVTPCWLSWQRIFLQYRWPRFDPWIRKIPCRRKWQPTPVFLHGKSHRQRSLAGYHPWGCKELDTTEHPCIPVQKSLSNCNYCWW